MVLFFLFVTFVFFVDYLSLLFSTLYPLPSSLFPLTSDL